MNADKRLDRIEDKLERLLEGFTELATQFDGIPGKVRVLEDKALTWESAAKGAHWLWVKVVAIGSVAGGVISSVVVWFIKSPTQ